MNVRYDFLLIGVVLLVCCAFVGTASATEIWVPSPGNETIQQAVNNATAGDTIIVRDGTYTENVDVNVAHITIRSENGSANCIVQALSASDHVFDVTADRVNISGFTIQNATGSGKAGIYLNTVDHCNISENTASSNAYGIFLKYLSNYNNLTGNTASNNNNGIYIDSFSDHNNLTNNNASDNNNNGIYLQYSSNNNLTGNTANSNNDYGIYLFGSSTNTLTDNTASNNDYGIRLSSSNTNTLTTNNASNNHNYGIYLDSFSSNLTGNIANSNGYGIYLDLGSYNYLTGNTASDNWVGIYLSSSSTNNITGNTANSNDDYGIYLKEYSNNNYLTGNTASDNWVGIYLFGSSNNDLTANKASNNRGQMLSSGIYLELSSTNNLTSNTASNNDRGILLIASTNNNLTGNTVHSSNVQGIGLVTHSDNNHIYNNYFDNTNNAWDAGNNIWNISKTAGTNIIGGPYLGGNYWSDYTGNDTDGDGLGETPYNIPGGANKDYLPLVAIFDTGQGIYPSIMGTHHGTITLNQTIKVSNLYTYPCSGTGGHTESIELYENDTLIANGTWNGYNGDYSNITLHNATDAFAHVMLLKDHVYNYTIRTGSYPQIIHEKKWNATGGTITCTEFTDANGRTYNNWIPAIRLWAD